MKKTIDFFDKLSMILLGCTTAALLCCFIFDIINVFTAIVGVLHIVGITYILLRRIINFILKIRSNKKS